VPFPHFDPVALHIWGPIVIRWYALAYIAGIILGWRYMVALVKRPRLWEFRGPAVTPLQIDDLILWVTLGVIVGGRLGHVIFYTPSIIWQEPVEILKTWKGGMSFHGGAIGVIVAGVLFARRKRLDMLRLGDLIAAAAPIGLFFGRIANFINGELWGRPTTLPWGIIFPGADGQPRHPSQLYEAALEGIVLFAVVSVAVWGARQLNRRGVVMGLFLAGYGLIRAALETVREPDSYMPHFPLGLTMGMILSTPMIVAGAWFIWRGLNEPIPTTPWVAPDEPAAEGAHEPA